MRNKYLLLLLAAGAFLSLTGCEKEPNTMKGDPQDVRFTVVTPNPETKTVYTGEGTVDDNNPNYLIWERISWVKGDKLLIWSDYAVDHLNKTKQVATYAVGEPQNKDFPGQDYPNQSWSIIKDEADLGLIYNDEYKDKKYQFWSIYPASAATNNPSGGTDASAKEVVFDIEASQGDTENEGTAPNIVLKPNMDRAVMLAAVDGDDAVDYNSDVEFKFYPAFTAFEFTLSTQDGDALDIHKVVLTSNYIQNSNSPLAGTVTATVTGGTRKNGSDYIGGSTYVSSETSNQITYTLPEGVGIPEGGELTFTVFALPQDITGLKLSFYDSDEKLIGTGRLAYNGEDITFGACQKHCIRGVKLPSGWFFSYFTLQLEVLDWDGVDITGDSSQFPQATQFAISGTGVLNGNKDLGMTGDGGAKDPYRQQWYFKTDQTVELNFKVMFPAGGSWELVPMGDDAGLFTITNVTEETESGDLWGNMYQKSSEDLAAISTNVKIKITFDGTGEHQFYFESYVYDKPNKEGNKFNIDSETQLYDAGRGYHTFIVNSPSYPTN